MDNRPASWYLQLTVINIMGTAEGTNIGPLILCVDDDPWVRDVTRAVLERGGYRVTVASGSQEAITVVEQARERISLVILDWLMPGMGALDAVHRLKEIQPDLRILLTSGHDRSTVMLGVGRAVEGFVAKPYAPKGLVEEVDRVLGLAAHATQSLG